MKKVGIAIALARAEQGLTPKELASKAGIRENILMLLENGEECVTLKSMIQVAVALGMFVDIIFTNQPPTFHSAELEKILKKFDEEDKTIKDIQLQDLSEDDGTESFAIDVYHCNHVYETALYNSELEATEDFKKMEIMQQSEVSE